MWLIKLNTPWKQTSTSHGDFRLTTQKENTRILEKLQNHEIKLKKNQDVYERLKIDVRMLRDQSQAIVRSLLPKVSSISIAFLSAVSNHTTARARWAPYNISKHTPLPQEQSLASLQNQCGALKATKVSLEEEMGTDLLSRLSGDDQKECDLLNEEITNVSLFVDPISFSDKKIRWKVLYYSLKLNQTQRPQHGRRVCKVNVISFAASGRFVV